MGSGFYYCRRDGGYRSLVQHPAHVLAQHSHSRCLCAQRFVALVYGSVLETDAAWREVPRQDLEYMRSRCDA